MPHTSKERNPVQSKLKFEVGFLLLACIATVALIAWPPGVAVRLSGATADGLIYDQFGSTGGGGVILDGTVVSPTQTGLSRPGVVLVGGGGPGKRVEQLPEAQAFARGGLVSLIYDKRTVGYSQFALSYSLLADDAMAAAQVLRTRAGIDPSNVGFWGETEGAWVTSLPASRSTNVPFLTTLGARCVPPVLPTPWHSVHYSRHAA